MGETTQHAVILLVDDDEPGRYAHARILRGAGYEVREAATGTEALEILAHERLDLAILDIGLPGVPGSEVLRRIRATPATAALPAMYLSATFADATSIAHGLEEGADAYLTKPVPPAVLLGQVHTLLRMGRIHRALQESEERSRELVQSADSAIFRWKPDGTITFLNEYAQQLLGYGEEEALGHDVRMILPRTESSGRDLMALVDAIVANPGARSHNVNENVCRDGSRLWLAWTNRPLFDPQGNVSEILSIGIDITARVQAEEALRQAEAELREAQRVARVGSWYWDVETDTVTASEQVYRMLGLDPALPTSVLREREWQLYTPQSQKRVGEAVQTALRTGTGYTLDVEARRADGTPLWLTARAEAVRGADGRIIGLRGTNQDVTERKQAEGEREAATAKYAAIFGMTSDGAWIHDLTGRIREVNDAYCRMSGYTRDEILGLPVSMLEAVETPEEIATHIRQVIESGGHDRFESRHRRKDGSVIDVDIAAVYLEREGGRIAIFVRDITARKQAELERERLHEELIRAERARADLAEHLSDEIAHRVKNNLAMISGLLQMQHLSEKDPKISLALREAISRIRTFADLHERMYASRAEQADLLVVLQQIGRTIVELFVDRGDVEIDVHGEPFQCDARVATNLSVVANELVTNALKHGGPGADGRHLVTVGLHCSAGDVVLSVWNSGAPAPDDLQPARSKSMGLRLVYDLIVEQYRGRFHLSPSNGGTLAEVFVPRDAIRPDSLPR